ncbi:MAG: hypothetical protein JST00_37950 [Deltaproteobacteria bacterium]|nr:hypothetical protein [Deltaproteobacteria bacterium]
MQRFVAQLAPPSLLVWLSLAEWKIFERLLFSHPPSVAFVVESVRGVLAGTPVSKAWAQRIVAPFLVSLLGGANQVALERFFVVTLVASNLLLYYLLRWRGLSMVGAATGIVTFGLARVVLAYKLEYPWDGADLVIFVAFGAWVRGGGSIVPLAPLLLLGAFNHETILYVPLWYLLASERKQRLAAAAAAAGVGVLIGVTRAVRYVGQPDLPGQFFDTPTPVIENHLHVAHNLRELFVNDWLAGRAHISVGFLAATAWFAWLARHRETRAQGVWSLVVLGSIVAFGFVNETRLYLVLVAFWIAHAWRDRRLADGGAT